MPFDIIVDEKFAEQQCIRFAHSSTMSVQLLIKQYYCCYSFAEFCELKEIAYMSLVWTAHFFEDVKIDCMCTFIDDAVFIVHTLSHLVFVRL